MTTEITALALESLAACPDARLRTLLQSLVRHLHAFAAENRLTDAELMAGIQFLTRTGQMCSGQRQEFILLSDTLGLSMLVDSINNSAGADATESTVLGPFYAPGSPWRANGDSIAAEVDAAELIVTGTVRTTSGVALPGATIDVWQNGANMLYAVQDPQQPPDNLRGRFRADDSGGFWFRTIRPVDYPIPDDGPVGEMLRTTGRHPWRPAHIHLIVSAAGHRTVTTHIFDAESPYLGSDAVFGVKESLVRQLMPSLTGGGYTVDIEVVLAPADS